MIHSDKLAVLSYMNNSTCSLEIPALSLFRELRIYRISKVSFPCEVMTSGVFQ